MKTIDNKEYQPYGAEWKKEIAKLRKDVLIDMLATALLKLKQGVPVSKI